MLAAFTTGFGKVELREVPAPRITSGEVLVEMKSCGICGTDVEKTRGETHTPGVLGHEVAGVIKGKADVSEVTEGDRVVVHHHVSCGNCYYCKSDSPTLCDLYQKTNLDPCGFAEYFRVPQINQERGAILRLPEEVSFAEASFIEPLGCCIRSLSHCGDVEGKHVAVLGAGSTGGLMIQLLKSMRAESITASDVSLARLAFCRRLGADFTVNPAKENLVEAVNATTDGRGVDLAIVATGNLRALDNALQITRKGGLVNLFGMPTKNAKLPIDPSSLFIRELKIVPSYSTTEEEMKTALSLISKRKIEVAQLISHRFKLRDVVEAFQFAADPEKSVKVLVEN